MISIVTLNLHIYFYVIITFDNLPKKFSLVNKLFLICNILYLQFFTLLSTIGILQNFVFPLSIWKSGQSLIFQVNYIFNISLFVWFIIIISSFSVCVLFIYYFFDRSQTYKIVSLCIFTLIFIILQIIICRLFYLFSLQPETSFISFCGFRLLILGRYATIIWRLFISFIFTTFKNKKVHHLKLSFLLQLWFRFFVTFISVSRLFYYISIII